MVTSAPRHALSIILLSSVAMASSSSKPANADVACQTKEIKYWNFKFQCEIRVSAGNK